MCDYCKRFDFGAAKCDMDRHGARIVNAGGAYRFPSHEQFNYCPNCGAPRIAVQKERERLEGGGDA